MSVKESVTVRIDVNGNPFSGEVHPGRLLVDFLRYDLGLTGTKEGCGVGVCGACAVLLDDKMISSCLALVVMADGSKITTVEGLALDGKLDSDEGEKLCMFLCPKLWEDNDLDTGYNYDKFKLLNLTGKLLLESHNMQLRLGAWCFFTDYLTHRISGIMNDPNVSRKLLKDIKKSKRPLESFYLGFLMAEKKDRENIIIEILESSYVWKYSLASMLLREFSFSVKIFKGSLKGKVPESIKKILLEEKRSPSLISALNILETFEDDEIDDAILKLLKRKGCFAFQLVKEKSFIHCRIHSSDFPPKSYSYCISQSLKEKNLRFFPFQDLVEIKREIIIKYKLEKKINKLIETVPPCFELGQLLRF